MSGWIERALESFYNGSLDMAASVIQALGRRVGPGDAIDFRARVRKENQKLRREALKKDLERIEAQLAGVDKLWSIILEKERGESITTEALYEKLQFPPEILARGPLAVKIYNKALQDGTTCVKRVAVMFIGQCRTGKTSLKKSLKGEKFDPMEKVTQGIEADTSDPSHFQVTTEILRSDNRNEENDSKSALAFEHQAARFITAEIMQEKSATFHDQESSPRSTDSTITKETSTNPEFSFPVERNDEDDTRVSVAQLPEPHLPYPELPEDIAKLVVKLLQKLEDHQDEEDIYSILWDFGGQSVYYTTHPIFLTRKAIYILAYDLSRNPHEKAPPPERKGLYKKTVPDSSCSKTNLDYLDFWMSSVYSLVNTDPIEQEITMCEGSSSGLPPVFLVCTHADEPYCKKNNPRELALEIFGYLQEKIYSKHLHEDVFVVDNTKSGSGQECSEVGRLKKKLLEVAQTLPQMKEAIPIKWLKYEKALTEVCKEGFKWIPLTQARKIALEVCQIVDEDEFQTSLNFLHDQRILIHFNETPELNERVFLDPQWLIDVFKKVITVKPYNPDENNFKKLWRKLEMTGILDAELLDHMWSPLFKEKETRESLIAIMERFSLLCPWPSSDDSTQYLVPSMLTSPPTDEVLNRPISARLPSLFIKFESGRVPPGLFPRLVLQFFQWSNEEWKNHMTPELFENFALFHICPVEGISVKLLCHPSSIEVIVDGESVLEVDGDLKHGNVDVIMTTARSIRRHLGLILECMRNEFFWLKNVKFKMCVCCPVCSPTGSVNYCRTHYVHGCTQDECLHFWTESELLSCQQQFVICPRPGLRGVPKIQINQFALWFAFEHEQQERNPADQQQTVAALALPSPVVESIQLSSGECNAKNVVVRLQECLELDPVSLAEPDIETKQMIRCLAKKARTENRLDVIKYLRDITPAGTTGPLLQEDLDVRCIPFPQRKNLTFSLSGGEEWKLLAERLGFSPIEIRFLDKRVTNPANVVLTTLGNHRYLSVGEIYDALVKCELPALADIM